MAKTGKTTIKTQADIFYVTTAVKRAGHSLRAGSLVWRIARVSWRRSRQDTRAIPQTSKPDTFFCNALKRDRAKSVQYSLDFSVDRFFLTRYIRWH